MFHPPDISVIIPVYNAEGTMERCLKSVTATSIEAMEIICINDGSTDNSASLLAEWTERDHRIMVLPQKSV